MSTAFQADSFQVDAFQIDASGVSLALSAVEGADACAASITVSALTASFALMATEGADACEALISLTINVGKPMSWVILPSRSYTQRIAAKGIVSYASKNRLVRGDA